jgi:hypothetical protein
MPFPVADSSSVKGGPMSWPAKTKFSQPNWSASGKGIVAFQDE